MHVELHISVPVYVTAAIFGLGGSDTALQLSCGRCLLEHSNFLVNLEGWSQL